MQLMSLSGTDKPEIIHSFTDPRSGITYGRSRDGKVHVLNGLGLLLPNLSMLLKSASTVLPKPVLPSPILSSASSTVSKLLQTASNYVPQTLVATAPIIPTISLSSAMPSDWDDALYLEMNPDVKNAIAAGSGYATGWQHYYLNGKSEGRTYASYALRAQRVAAASAAQQAALAAAQAKAQAEQLAAQAKAQAEAAAQAALQTKAQVEAAVQATSQALPALQQAAKQGDALVNQAVATTNEAVNQATGGSSKTVLILGGAALLAGGLLLMGKKKKSLGGTTTNSLSGLPVPRKSSRKSAAASRKRASRPAPVQAKAKKAGSAPRKKLAIVNFR